jgi:rare lipoprotein A
MRGTLCAALAGLVLLGACASRGPQRVGTEPTVPREEGWVEKGDASWYGEPYHGRQTASGEIYDMYELTAAHRSLPFGTVVEVTRRDTGDDVTVRINDRGPFIAGRIIDLSFAAAKRIGLDIDGVAPVRVEVVKEPDARRPPPRRPPAAVNATCLWVQVGAFGDAGNARRAVERLTADGFKALAMEGPDGLERVRVGPFDESAAAEEALQDLRPEWPSARVVDCG